MSEIDIYIKKNQVWIPVNQAMKLAKIVTWVSDVSKAYSSLEKQNIKNVKQEKEN